MAITLSDGRRVLSKTDGACKLVVGDNYTEWQNYRSRANLIRSLRLPTGETNWFTKPELVCAMHYHADRVTEDYCVIIHVCQKRPYLEPYHFITSKFHYLERTVDMTDVESHKGHEGFDALALITEHFHGYPFQAEFYDTNDVQFYLSHLDSMVNLARETYGV